MFADSLLALAALISLQSSTITGTSTLALQELPVARYVAPSQPIPVSKNPDSVGIEVTAKAAAVMDAASGQFLFGKDIDTKYPIASMTKLMTAMVFLEQNPNLDQEIVMSPEDRSSDGKQIFLPEERLTKRELLQALLIGSVNEAGNAIARLAPGGTEAFIAQMNAKAKSLGLRATFEDPTGLSSGNRATVRDVATMMKTALSSEQIRSITTRSSITIVGRVSKKPYLIKSTNLLLGTYLNKAPYEIVGGKTGSLPEAGFCLVQDTRRNQGGEVITVVMGSENHFSRFEDAKVLTAWAFENYTWPTKQAAYKQLVASR